MTRVSRAMSPARVAPRAKELKICELVCLGDDLITMANNWGLPSGVTTKGVAPC